jgi:hypothetical protein
LGWAYQRSFGAMAQLVAHLHGMQGVRGSSPLSSTIPYGMVRSLRTCTRRDGIGSQRTVDAMSIHNPRSHQPEASPSYEPWSVAIPYLTGQPRPVKEGGLVQEAHGWKVARLADPFEGVFSGYSHGRYRFNDLARCLKRSGCSEVPALGCDCGFNAMKTRESAVRLLERWRGFLLLEVDLYGRIVEHRDGWRAEEQDVLRIHVPARCSRFICRRGTTGFRRRRAGWYPACTEHLDSDGVLVSVLRQHGVDVVLIES